MIAIHTHLIAYSKSVKVCIPRAFKDLDKVFGGKMDQWEQRREKQSPILLR